MRVDIRRLVRACAVIALLASTLPFDVNARQAAVTVPDIPLSFGVFSAQFRSDGTFSLSGEGWPTLRGTWIVSGSEMVLKLVDAPSECADAGSYAVASEQQHLLFTLVRDACTPRRMILDRSQWRPASEALEVAERRISHTAEPRLRPLPRAASPAGRWPSFRGLHAAGVADGRLPDRWSGTSGENILWRTPVPGLAHSSPIVWGDTVFVTTAISSRKDATFKPGLYGDGDASDDRSVHKWVLYALDKKTGRVRWERIAREGAPRNKRHIKSTYASASPATDGRIVVAWFGSEGVHAWDIEGTPLWHVEIGRVNMGAYDIPTYEWGPASSPIIWNGL